MNVDAFAPFGDLLKALRKQKKVSQQDLAAKLNVHRNTIGAWERGDRLPDSKGIVLELAHQLRLDEQATRRLLEASLLSISPRWSVPYLRNAFFRGRHEILEQLENHLSPDLPSVALRCCTLSGLAGVGKTQLALEYAYRHYAQYAAVFWIGAETLESVIASFATIADVLQLPERLQDQDKMIAAVKHWLAGHREWLLIFDNVEDVALVKNFLPAARQGALLCTTRGQTLGALGQHIEVASMTVEEGAQFLLHRATLRAPETVNNQSSPADRATVRAIVEIMDGLPLALDQAGAYIYETKCNFATFLQLFRKHSITLLQETNATSQYPMSITKTFYLAFENIMKKNVVAAELLIVCAFLAPDGISEEMLISGAHFLGPQLESAIKDELLFNAMLRDLLAYSFIQRNGETKMLTMHRLVQEVVKAAQSEGVQRTYAEHIVKFANHCFPDPGEYAHNWMHFRQMLPNVFICQQLIDRWEIQGIEARFLLHKAGSYLVEQGQYEQGEMLLKKAKALREQVLGTDHPEVAFSLSRLGTLAVLLGKYSQAEQLYQQALTIRESALGPDHPLVAATLNEMGLLYRADGRYAEAEALYIRGVQIKKAEKPGEPVKIAISLNNLALVYCNQGKYEEAEKTYAEAHSLLIQNLGDSHFILANNLHNTAKLYYHQLRYEESEHLYRQSLAMFKLELGEEHPSNAHVLNNLGLLYRDQGRYADAEHHFQLALSLREQKLGKEHPLVADCLEGLAEMHSRQGNCEEARNYYKRCLLILKQVWGEDHANVLRIQGMLEGVEKV